MECVTNKNCYDSKEIAEETLIQNRSYHYHPDDGGPINVYKCNDCGYYHFTSKGEKSQVLKDSKSKIDSLREANHWEWKLR